MRVEWYPEDLSDGEAVSPSSTTKSSKIARWRLTSSPDFVKKPAAEEKFTFLKTRAYYASVNEPI